MHRVCRAGWLCIVALLASACRDSGQPASLSTALVAAQDLPGDWLPFEAESGEGSFCGVPSPGDAQPEQSAAVAMAIDPDDGPIFGERIERYGSGDAAMAALRGDLDLPCEFTSTSGSRWRMEALDPPNVGAAGRVFLITSLDRPDSYNYDAAIVSGDVVLLAALNTRQPDRELLDQLIDIAWSNAANADLVSDGP